MKEWALAHGATHYTHWFVPMTGSTAEKHDSFLTPTGDGQTIAEFSGKNLRPGRAGRAARSRRAASARRSRPAATPRWDVTSPIFLQVEPNGVTMTIPTAYVSYTGEALDHKIPLLRSQEALGKQALRVLRWFGNTTATRVFTNIGPEQEYFLVDRRLAEQRPGPAADRPDAVRRPVAQGPGARGPVLRLDPRADPRVHDGSRPRAVAPRHPGQDPPQRGGARPVRDGAGLRADLGRLRPQHGRDEPDAPARAAARPDVPDPREAVRRASTARASTTTGRWRTDDGENLLDPGNDPHANAQFLAFLVAVIRGVNVHADLLRASIADAGQDHRLGANEAPPAIMSIFLGSQLEDVIEPARAGRRVGVEEGRLGRARRHLAAGPAEGRDGPQPDLAVRLHRQQVRVPGGRLVGPDLLAADRPQHGRRRLAQAARRRARQAQAGRLRRA